MPEPLSPKSGLGMKVAVLPFLWATCLTTYLYFIWWSAIATILSNCMSISHWPAVATSWCWHSTVRPILIMVSAISARRSARLSLGGTGK